MWGRENKELRTKKLETAILIVACLVWVGTIGFGMKILWAYKSTPGPSGTRHPEHWPTQSSIPKHQGRATLLMFGHPNCPCTRASVHELGTLATRFRDQVDTYVIFAIADGLSNVDEDGDLWSRAASIPGVKVIRDEHGAEARRFGVETSGHTLLYSTNGILQFSGGITQVRGHEGESFGRQRIISLITTGTADRYTAPVFGCSMFGPHDSTRAVNREAKKEDARN